MQTAMEGLQSLWSLQRLQPGVLLQPLQVSGLHLHPTGLPQGPVDADRVSVTLVLGYETVAGTRISVQKPIRRRIGSLADISPDAGDRGEQDKEIQLLVPTGPVEIHRPAYLGI